MQLEEEIAKLRVSLDEQQKSQLKSNAQSLENIKTLSNENQSLKDQMQQKDVLLKEYQSKVYTLSQCIISLLWTGCYADNEID